MPGTSVPAAITNFPLIHILGPIADLVARFLHRDVKRVLLHYGVALALVVAGRVGLFGLFSGSAAESITQEHSARRAGGGGKRITVGKFVAEIRAARTERHVADGARGASDYGCGSECEAVAAQAEEFGVAVAGGFDASEELMRRVRAAVRVTSRVVLMPHRHSRMRCFSHIQGRAVTSEDFHG